MYTSVKACTPQIPWIWTMRQDVHNTSTSSTTQEHYSYCLTSDDQPVTHINSACAGSKLQIIYQQNSALSVCYTGRHRHSIGRKQIVSLSLALVLVNSPTLASRAHWAAQGSVGQSASTFWQGIIRHNRCFHIAKEQAPCCVLPADSPTRLAHLTSSKYTFKSQIL